VRLRSDLNDGAAPEGEVASWISLVSKMPLPERTPGLTARMNSAVVHFSLVSGPSVSYFLVRVDGQSRLMAGSLYPMSSDCLREQAIGSYRRDLLCDEHRVLGEE
jgi:hypothetical protein